MYVNPFWFGVFCTISFEAIAALAYGVWCGVKDNDR